MELQEYQTKKILSQYKISIPKGYVIKNKYEIKKILKKFKKLELVAKCQVLLKSRNRIKAVQEIHSLDQIKGFVSFWIDRNIKINNYEEKVRAILVEKKITIKKEIYFCIFFSREKQKIFYMFSKFGGNKLKEKKNFFTKVKIFEIFPTKKKKFNLKKIEKYLNFSSEQKSKFFYFLKKIIRCFLERDFLFLEINPLAIDNKNNFFCLDAKSSVDENAFFRQKKITKLIFRHTRIFQKLNKRRIERKKSIFFKSGNISVIANGAGLAMCTIDTIMFFGGKVRSFLDLKGGIKEEEFLKILEEIVKNTKIKVVIVNIFGGIVKCDFIAKCILKFEKKNIFINTSIVVRFSGNNCKIGKEILIKKYKNQIYVTSKFSKAIQKCIKFSKYGNTI
ncbi:ATP-grasp domain-containing protein [bacterium endosymbiont of Pedicinus badii]|uniref:ATP-grasp domain-containing protein n=1 Tax=bacterium endosymbiont of Pedicinus badii TaxID=1719126 RepID=UPI0009BB9E5A|nr:ATP-grasp domain-containing protein [bacterium endosymbiont of Pedicinus badii]OQM34318.1 hypothetical protein AOQ89_00265 [bacterium endosymbiont of Pedicinus badii]